MFEACLHSSVSNETYYGTVDPYNRFYGWILSVVMYSPLTIGLFTDSKRPIWARPVPSLALTGQE